MNRTKNHDLTILFQEKDPKIEKSAGILPDHI
jgi:hypothetical protein